jgi:Fur family transcriptional regulator, iron response regulator
MMDIKAARDSQRPGATRRPDVAALLRASGLRPTRQRLSLGTLLFDGIDRHVTAEMLHEQAIRASVPVSLATVYNTLHQFTHAGLLREVAVDGAKSYFDTNTSDHHHFYFEDECRLIDIDGGSITVSGLPQAPEGMEIAHIDVVVRIKRAS